MALIFVIVFVTLLITLIVISLFGRKRWNKKRRIIGCVSQIILFLLLIVLLPSLILSVDVLISHSGTMVCVRYIEEEGDCQILETWYIKEDGTCHYELDKGSHEHAVNPCGNDFLERKHKIERIESKFGIKTDFGMEVSFDINKQIVIPYYYGKPVEIVSVDRDRVEKYFKKSHRRENP